MMWFANDFHSFAIDGLFWLSIVTSPQSVCYVMTNWGTGIVMSYSSIVLHVQIGKVEFVSQSFIS